MKYEFVIDDTKVVRGVTVTRIRALEDSKLYKIKKGDLGGYIECPYNLSQQGQCWVGPEANVLFFARVEEDALCSAGTWLKGTRSATASRRKYPVIEEICSQ